jgi:hypothetical protein
LYFVGLFEVPKMKQLIRPLALGIWILTWTGLGLGRFIPLASAGQRGAVLLYVLVFLAGSALLLQRMSRGRGGIAVSLVGIILGVVLGGLAWREAGLWRLDLALERVRSAGYSVSMPADPVDDLSEANATVLLEQLGDDKDHRLDVMDQPAKGTKGPADREFLHQFVQAKSHGQAEAPSATARVVGILRSQNPQISMLERALACPHRVWNVHFTSNFISTRIPRMSPYLALGDLLEADAILHPLHMRRRADQIRDLAGLIAQEQSLIGAMVGVSLENRSLDLCAGWPSQAKLQAQEPDFRTPVYADLQTELFFRLSRLASLDLLEMSKEFYGGFSGSKIVTAAYWPFLPWDIASQVDLGALEMDKCLAAPSARASAEDSFENYYDQHAWYFARIAMPKFDQMYLKSLVPTARWRMAQVAALMRAQKASTGKWPASLRELQKPGDNPAWFTDPLMQAPFSMKILKKGPEIFSPGINGVDDGGKPGSDDLVWNCWI